MRVQQGLMPMKLAVSIWSGFDVPKVIVKCESISWCTRFCAVTGRWLGWMTVLCLWLRDLSLFLRSRGSLCFELELQLQLARRDCVLWRDG